MIRKAFGIIKLGLGIILIIIIPLVLLNVLKANNTDDIYLFLGYFTGILCMLLLGLYWLYSGWTEIKHYPLKQKKFVWVGLGMETCTILMFISFFFDKKITFPLAEAIFISVMLILGIRDIIRIRNNS